ncbi:hypothetical protein HDG34_003173 [Paraburkholderia sp. HC6.4b]|uniref:hypothetical protein n=1 Tax=unclassified Paraburkholderia TaxID=2615204 RepID=UPI0016180255|nr:MULTISPECIES: hypothetical protein [unclassified Paraburkholderia]MBB5409232.1 hypothetical protein [Paraburkholderia sp. HC6.4b]MBB5450960.1 hypothetical protein [Paraburkholderia sp. Kb1A]
MKQKFATIAIMSALLAVLSTTAHAAYTEQWMSPQDLRKEEAAHSKRHKPADACTKAATHCNTDHSKAVRGKSGTQTPSNKSARPDDPIATFAQSGNTHGNRIATH